MELHPPEMRQRLPELYTNEELGLTVKALVKFRKREKVRYLQDKLIAYNRVLTENCEGSSKSFYDLQKIRQSADTHLLKIIKAIRGIKHPPVNVVVNEAEQVNIAEQINQGDKQVNIAKNQCSKKTQNS